MMEKIKRFLSSKLVEQVLCSAIAIALYSLIDFMFTGSFADWFNSVTDVFMGVILGQIAFSMYEVFKGDAKYKTWQYFFGTVLAVVSLSLFFTASRAESTGVSLVSVILSAFFFVAYVLERKYMYEPSTLTFDEAQERTWAYMRVKAKKYGREKFLAWEKTFRAYPTCNGSTTGDLDFSAPYGAYEDNGRKVPLTFEMAKAKGLNDIAVLINDDLVRELDTDGIK